MQEMLITILFVVLLPIVPAFVLFKALPGKANISGPFKGFKINFAGSFAGYFVVAILAYTMSREFRDDQDKYPKYEEYRAAAQIRLDGAMLGASLDPRLLQVTLYPKADSVSDQIGADTFRLNVVIPTKRSSDGKINFPFEGIIVQYGGYFNKIIPLSDGKVDAENRSINFQTVELAQKPPAPEMHQVVELHK